MNVRMTTALAAASAFLLPLAAQAHTQAETGMAFAAGGGLSAGLAHPFAGLDHLLAMAAVGVWAAQSGGRKGWAVPAAFVGMMGVGGGMALLGVGMPMVEGMIAASVLVLGLLVAGAVRLPVAVAAGLAGLFALFHGHAHGAEMPLLAEPALYGLGMITGTIALHAAGFGFGRLAGRFGGSLLVRLGGGAVAAAGLMLLVG